MAAHDPSTTQQTIDWNEQLLKEVRSALAPRNLSKYRAALEIGWDLSSFQAWLAGKSIPYPKIVRRLAHWLGESAEQTHVWETGAKDHKRIYSGHGARSVSRTCAVCGTPRIVRLAQLSRRSRYPWTCSRRNCSSLVRLLPGPNAHAGNYAVFETVRKLGSSRGFQSVTRLSDREVHRLCTDPTYAPQAKTVQKLAAIPGYNWPNLFPTRAEDKWSKNLARFRTTHPKGSAAAKQILGDRAGLARKGLHFPKLSAALREAALRKMEEDPKYKSALLQRLTRGQQSPAWRAKRLLLVHLRVPDPKSPRRLVFRSPTAEVPDSLLREWAAADERRTGIPAGYLLQVWKRQLGIATSNDRGGRPQADARFELVMTLRRQGLSAAQRAHIVSEREGKRINPNDLSRWERRYLSRLRQRTKDSSSA